MDFESEFYRFFWLVPLPFFLAYALVETGSRLKKGWKRVALIAAVADWYFSVISLLSSRSPRSLFRKMFIKWKMIF